MAAIRTHPHTVVDELRSLLGAGQVLADPDELLVYECDGFPIAKGLPLAVVFPRSPEQVAGCVQLLARHGVPLVPRGTGTGLAGGAVAYGEGVIVCTSRMTRIESIDLPNRVAVVEAGVRNTALSDATVARSAAEGLPAPLYFSPDPSSQKASTIAGNAATCAGGITTLKHGVTTQHILGLEMVLADGSVLRTRTEGLLDGLGADLPALVCGSEGTLGIITRVWCRLTPKPQHFRTFYATYGSTFDACATVSDIIAAGIIPAAMEMMDGAMVKVVEDAFHYGFPADAQALLLVELDGVAETLDEELQRVLAIAQAHQARGIQQCADARRRAELWSARKRAFGAIGRLSRSYCTQDACIPRSKLPEAVAQIVEIGRQRGLQITNVFHAGDGNVHPIFLFDEDDPAQVQEVLRTAEEVLAYCISIGGTITGEHGVGVEKIHLMPKLFNEATIRTFQAIKATFDPRHLANEGKLIPSERLCIELLKPTALNTPGGAT